MHIDEALISKVTWLRVATRPNTVCGNALLLTFVVALFAGSSLKALSPPPASVPVLSLPSGNYSSAQTLTITDATEGATIYYTIDDSYPNSSSSQYSGPLSITSSVTVEAIAIAPGCSASAAAVATYTYPASAPTLSLASGTYSSTQTLSMAASTPNAIIYYTTDGSTPSHDSSHYFGPVTVASSETVQAITFAATYNSSPIVARSYTITSTTAPPTTAPAPGNYTSAQSVTITDSTPGAVIYYTTNGVTPTTSSPVYSGPISISTNSTLQAVALAAGDAMSSVASAAYTIAAAVPGFSPSAGTYLSVQSVTIQSSPAGATIYYTTNGSTPTTSSAQYTGPLTVSSTETIQAMALASGISASQVSKAVYTIALPAATPTFAPAAGSYAASQTVTISDSTAGAAIYYTADGTTPTVNSTRYTGPVLVASTEILKAVAVASGSSTSSTGSAPYTIASTAVPTILPAAGTYNVAITISITDVTLGATIYYTTDGSLPTSSSYKYTGPFTANSAIQIRALAIGPLGPASSIPSASYNIFAVAAAMPVFPEAGGKFTTIQTAAITDATPGAAIYYTTDGSTPTSSSTLYAAPIAVATTETIRAVAYATGTGLTPIPSGIGSLYFYIVLPTAVPVISPGTGTYSLIQQVTITDSTPGAVIYYQLGGGYPSTSSTVYTGPISASNDTIIRALALAPNDSISSSVRADYTVIATAPSITPTSGSFLNSTKVTMSDKTPGSAIHYTTDGSVPTTTSPLYSGPIVVTPYLTATQSFQAIAVATGYQNSSVTQAQFTITLPAGILATAQVGTTPKMTIPPTFLGIGHDLTSASQIIGQASTGYNAAYRTLLANLQTNLTGPMSIRINGDQSTLASVQVVAEPLNEVAQTVGTRLLLGVDMYTDNPALAQSEAEAYASVIPLQYIDAIEVGNEPDNYYKNAYHPSTYSLANYMTDVVTWNKAVRTGAGETVPIMEPSYASLPWVPGTEADIQAGTFAPPIVSQHYYVTGTSGSGTIAPDVLLQPASATAGPLKYSAYAAIAHQAGLLFRMGEINSVWGGGLAGVSNTFSSTLWSIDTSFEYLNDGMDGLNWYSANYSAYQLFEFDSWVYEDKTYYRLNLVAPLYYGLLGFAQVAGHGAKLLPVTSSTASNVKIWATVDNTSKVHVVVINKDESATGNVQITLPGFTTGTVRYLIAPSYSSTSGVTIGGQTFDKSTDGTIQGQLVTTTIVAAGGVFTLPAVPITCAAIIDFSN